LKNILVMKKLSYHGLMLLVGVLFLTVSCQRTKTISTENAYNEFVTQIQMQQVFPNTKTFINSSPKVSKDSIAKQYERAILVSKSLF